MDAALRYVAKKEKFDLPDEAASQIIKDSAGNLRKALLVLEALKMQSCVLSLLYSPYLPSHPALFSDTNEPMKYIERT